MTGILWAIVAVLVIYQYKREVNYRTEALKIQLDVISKRLIDAYDRNIDMRQFMNFVNTYFDNELLSEASVCVYDSQTGRLEYSAGLPVLHDFSEAALRPEFNEAAESGVGETLSEDKDGTLFYYKALKSDDGKIYVHTFAPYTVGITDAIATEPDFWLIIATMIINIETVDETDFPHDELGDISRQIVKLYIEKDEAVERCEREHQIALHAIEDKARTKKQLTNNINHELKTPIGVIKGYIDTIMANPDMDEDTRNRFMSRTRENVERLCSLLNDVSEITRLEDGAGNIPLTEVDFHDLVFTIESDLRATGIAGNMKFTYDLPFDCTVKGNAGLLSGLVSNLIKNAVQHSRGTEMGLRMVVESEKYYTFSFYDNGTGVDAEHLPHLFERFYRIDAGRSRKVGGTGLGLPIVKSTVEALGGSISVHNRTGGGLEFVFTLKKWN